MDEDILLNLSNDDEDLLAGHSDREDILNMLDDPINDDIMNPNRGLTTPKTNRKTDFVYDLLSSKEHKSLFMTP